MNKRNILIVAVVAALAVASAFFVVNRQGTSGNKADVIQIGANLALTSSFPLWSQQIRDGLILAVEQFNEQDTQSKVSLVIEDNQGKAQSAASAFQKLANVDRVSAVVSTHTPLSQPLQSMSEAEKVPLLGTVVSAVGFGEVNKWSFLDWPSHDDLTPPVAKHSIDTLGSKRAATLVVNDDYGLDGARVFKKSFEELGGTLAAAETFTNQDTNMRDQLSRALAQNIDTIYTVGREKQIIAVVRQAREMGFKGDIVGVNAFDAPEVWSALGETANGIIFAGVGAEDYGSEDYKRFHDQFVKRFARAPDWIALYGYTIGQYLTEAAAAAQGDREKLRETLSSLDTKTLRGNTRMTKARAIRMPIVLYRRSNGENLPVQ
jgi:branched-chain amino acid transport system substrate-binding protein